jgi:hypothetical protein
MVKFRVTKLFNKKKSELKINKYYIGIFKDKQFEKKYCIIRNGNRDNFCLTRKSLGSADNELNQLEQSSRLDLTIDSLNLVTFMNQMSRTWAKY